MLPLYERHHETLTTNAIIRSFETIYEAVHNTKPECEHLSGNWFLVNGQKRDRRWLILEVECLRQKLIVSAVSNSSSYTGDKRRAISLLNRMLSRVD